MSVFVKQDNQWVIRRDLNDGGSINDYLQALGYDHNQFYSYTDYHLTYDDETRNDNIFSICLKVMTEEIICVITNKGRVILTDEDVRQYMKNFDFNFQYSLYTLESDLKSAVAERNYTIKFVADALGLPYSPDDSVLHSDKYNYNFFFKGGILVGYETADGYNREAHELRESSPGFFELIEKHARSYHGTNENDIVKEINIQAKAYENLPGGVRNEYFYDFQNADKSFNMAMLLVTKYQESQYELCLNYEDCKCVCHNELIFDSESVVGLDRILKYKYRSYILSFDAKGQFISCTNGRQDYYDLEGNEGVVENLESKVKKIFIQLPGSVATLTFLKRVLVNRMANTEETYGLTAEGDFIDVYNLETREHLYQFENRLISRIIGRKLVAAMFQNINLDDIENPKVDLYIAFPGEQ